ncbi:hypothetical protein D3C79_732340 [compost metagenome]
MVRNVDFLLTDDGPVVAVWRTVEQAVFVVHAKTSRAGRRVITHGRCATNPALARAVLPGLARGGGRIDELVTDHDLAFLAHRFQGGEQEVGGYTVRGLQGFVRARPDREDLVVDLFQHLFLVGVHHRLAVVGLFSVGAPLQGMVEHQLAAVLRDRERRGTPGVFGVVVVILEFGSDGVFLDLVFQALIKAEVAVARVDRDLESIRVSLEQRLLAIGQVVGVLVHVLRIDHEQRFFRGVRIRVRRAGAGVFESWRQAAPFAGPGRDAAVGVAGFFGAHRGQVLAQAGGFFGADLGVGQATAEQADGQRSAQ